MAGDRRDGSRRFRVGRAVQEALAEVLREGSFRDPVLRDRSVTVLEVRMSPDLRRADVFVLPFGERDDAAAAETVEGLDRAAPFLAGEVARRARLRYAPRLRFRLDRQLDHAADLDRLLGDRRPADAV